MHLTDRDMQLLADGESLGDSDAYARAHLGVCLACTAEFARTMHALARDADLLRALDAPVPTVSSDAVMVRAARPARTGRTRRSLRRTIVVGAAWLLGAAAAAMVVSPLHRLAKRALAFVESAGAERTRTSSTQQAKPPLPAGVAFRPGSEVIVLLRTGQAVGTLRISLVSSAMVRLSQHGGPVAYALTTDGVVVENAGSTASFDLELPAAVAHAEVRVAGQLVFRKRGATLVSAGPRQRDGGYLVSLNSRTSTLRSIP